MPDERRRAIAERIWFGDRIAARAARVALLPASALFRTGVALRDLAYREGIVRTHPSRIPAVSVGNLTVGGTGKTPFAALLVAELRRLGARPAIVMRGVGADESEVHALLNPGTPVIVSSDRVLGVARAAETGADIAVLDDAFQHRRVARAEDIVLLSADAWDRPRHLLPAGAWREPLGALRRASLAVVTRKAATEASVAAALRAIGVAAPALPTALVRLEAAELRRLDDSGAVRPIASMERRRVLAIAAIGDPRAFLAQLAAAGAESVDAAIYADHHAFTAADAASLRGRGRDADLVVCTLKDAVKLGPLWPRAGAPLWYVSQRVVVEAGAERLDALLAELLRRRQPPHSVGATPDAVSQPS